MPILDIFDDDDDPENWSREPLLASEDLGPCCACEKTGPDVRNIMMLHRLSPTPSRGWGCVQCSLPLDYASAVLCDACLESNAEIKFICTDYPASDGRTPVEEAPEIKVKHNPLYHPEMVQAMTWFDDSPDYGYPECLCSICGDPIPDLDDLPEGFAPLRLFKLASAAHPHGQEARFCVDCVPAMLRYMKLVEATDG